MNKVKKYLLNNLVAFDQAVNTICGGDPDETISSRLGKKRDGLEKFFSKIVNKIFFWQKKHCENEVEPDEGKDSVL